MRFMSHPGEAYVEIGEVILTRLVSIQDQLEFSTSAAYLPAAEITDLADKLEAARKEDAETYPDATHDEFMRRHNHLLVHHALAEAKVQGRPPVARLDPNRERQKSADRSPPDQTEDEGSEYASGKFSALLPSDLLSCS